jgi:hypothetical protein
MKGAGQTALGLAAIRQSPDEVGFSPGRFSPR